MEHQFNCEIARKYGVNEAIFVHNLYYWILKNEANGRHYYEGKNWTYNSMKAFTKLFPYWTARQIETVIKKCKDNGLIYVGNFNENTYDRTMWYALTENVKCIYAKCEMDFTENVNGFTQNVKPIPDNKPNSKPDNNYAHLENEPEDKEKNIKKSNTELLEKCFNYFWKKYPRKVKKKDTKKKYLLFFKNISSEDKIIEKAKEILSGLNKAVDYWQSKYGEDTELIPYPITWLNGERWNDEIELTDKPKSLGQVLGFT